MDQVHRQGHNQIFFDGEGGIKYTSIVITSPEPGDNLQMGFGRREVFIELG